MSSIDFTAILGKQVGTAPEPKPLPSGTYVGVIKGVPKGRLVKTKEGEKPILTVTIGVTEAMEDVDQEALSESGGLLRNDGEAKQVRADFWLDENSLYRLDQFLATFGYNADSGRPYTEVLEELPGREVTVAVVTEDYTNNRGETRTATNVSKIFANG